jgi:DNA mismatch repair protein MutL
MIPRGRWPAAALFVNLRPADVDVNVHPMKTEVRLRNSGAVFELVYHAIRDRLADQTREPTLPDQADEGKPPDWARGTTPSAPGRMEQTERVLRLTMDVPAAPSVEQRPLGLGYAASSKESALSSPNRLTFQNRGTEARAKIPNYSRLKIVGQVFAGYIALEGNEGLILVDQHAAHERITFEKLRAELRAGQIMVQSRLVPETIELNPARAGLVQSALPQLRALGFDVEAFGASTLVLNGAPAVFGPDAGPALLSEMIEGINAGGPEMRGEEAFEELLKQLACHGSIRVGRTLEEREIRELLAELDRTEFKTNCPHGRPVHIEFGRGNIERMFRR